MRSALDDEYDAGTLNSDDYDTYLTERMSETPVQQRSNVSALDDYDDEDEDEVGYGGGADDYAPVTTRTGLMLNYDAGGDVASARPAIRRSPEMQARLDQFNQALAQRAAAGGGDAAGGDTMSYLRSLAANPDQLQQIRAGGTVPLDMGAAPKVAEDEGGLMQIAGRGLMRATEDLKQGKDIAEGKKPRDSATPLADYEQSLELADFADPAMAAKKLWYGLYKSYPAIGMSLLGTAAGAGIGAAVSAPTGPGVIGGTAIGGILGGAAGMGTGAMLQELGPAYHAEREAIKEGNPDREITDEEDAKAWNSAVVRAGISGGISGAASMALFGFGKPVGNALKGVLTPVVAGAPRAEAGIAFRAGTQLGGQTGISVGSEVGVSAIEGKPLDTNLSQAVAGGLANVLPDVAAAAGGRVIRGIVGRRQGEATPGVSDDQAAALAATTGTEPPPTPEPVVPPGVQPGPGGTPLPDTPVPPGRRFGTPEPPPPPPPPPGGPGGADLGGGPAGPGGAGVPPLRPPPPGGPGGTPLGPEPTPSVPGGGPEQFGPPPPLGPSPGGTPLGPEPTPAPPIPPVRPTGPTPAGPGGAPLGPEPTPAPPPAPEPPPRRPPPPGPGGTPLPEEMPPRPAPRTTLEPDHLDPTRTVAKDEDGVVIGKGASMEEALADAQARQRAPYPEEAPVTERTGFTAEVPAEQAKPAESGTKGQLVSEQIAPGLAADVRRIDEAGEQAKARQAELSPAERAGIRLTEEQQETGAVGKPLTKAQQRKADAQAKLAEVKEKAAAPKAGEAAEQIIEARKTEVKDRMERVGRKAQERAEQRAAGGIPGSRLAGPLRTAERAPAKPVEKMTATELRTALRELGQGPSITRTMKVAELRDLYRQETGRTKGGAYTSPGEAAEPQAPRPAVKTQSDLQADVAKDAAKARSRGLVSEATRQMAAMPPAPEADYPVTPGLETTRKARAIIENILAGQKIADAVAAFGPGSSRGRPRNVKSLSQYIRAELESTETPAKFENTRSRLLSGAAAELKKIPIGDARRDPIIEKLTADLHHLDQLQKRRPLLEQALAGIEQIEAGGTIKGVESRGGRIREMGRDVRAQAIEYFSRRREINQPIVRQLEQSGEHGSRLHDLLDTLSGDPTAAQLAPQMTELARILRRVLPNVEVHDAVGRLSPDVVGVYAPKTRRVYLDLDAASPAVNLLHESVHAGTFDYVNRLYQAPEGLLNPQELAHKFALNSIFKEIQRLVDDGTIRRSATEDAELRYALNLVDDPSINATGPHELASQILTTPELYNLLTRERASPEFRSALERVGMGVSARASIWDGFKRIIRNIFGIPERLDSVFDLALRPLTEIVETGARYAKEIQFLDSLARKNANALEGGVEKRILTGRREIDDALGALPSVASDALYGTKRAAARATLASAMSDAIYTYAKPFFERVGPVLPGQSRNSLLAHQKAKEDVTRTINEEMNRKYVNSNGVEETGHQKVLRLEKQLTELPDAPALNGLMTRATTAGFHLGRDRADGNAHLVTDEQRNRLAAMEGEFDRLSSEAQQTYREVRSFYTDTYNRIRQAGVENIVRYAFPEVPQSVRDSVVRQMSTRQGVMDIIDAPDTSNLAAQFAGSWGNKKLLVQEIAKLQRAGFVDGDYFPLRREGDFVVTYGTPNQPGYGVEMFLKDSEAQQRRDELIRGDPNHPTNPVAPRTDVSQVFNKAVNQPGSMFHQPERALGPLERALENSGLDDGSQAAIRDLYIAQVLQQGTRMATDTLRRQGVEGASVKHNQIIVKDFLSHASRMGHLRHGGDVVTTLAEMDRHAKGLRAPDQYGGDRKKADVARLVVDEMRNRAIPADGDNSSTLIGQSTRLATSGAFMTQLMRPAHLTNQLIGTHTVAASLLGARHGAATFPALTRAVATLSGTAMGAAGRNMLRTMRRELFNADWDMSTLYRDRMVKTKFMEADHADMLRSRMDDAGLVNHTEHRELRRLAGERGWLGGGKYNYLSKAMDMFGAAEHALDSMNRFAVAAAAFDLEFKRNGRNANEAVEYAVQTARDVMPNYNLHNKARIATGKGPLGQLAGPAMQYKLYGLHIYGVMGNLGVQMHRNARGSAERAEAKKALAYLIASHAALSGVTATVFGSLPVMFGMGLYDYFTSEEGTKRPHTAKRMETYARNFVYDNAGKTASQVFSRGLFGLAGIDAHQSYTLANALGVGELKTWDVPGFTELAFKTATGASGDQGLRVLESIGKMVRGDLSLKNMEVLMPRTARDISQAYGWATEGVKDAKGVQTIVPAGQISATDIITKAFGYNPTAVTAPREARSAINLEQDLSEEQSGAVIRRLATAKTPAERQQARQDIMLYNKMHPHDPITGQRIQQRLREQARINATPGIYGLRIPKADLRYAKEVGRFGMP